MIDINQVNIFILKKIQIDFLLDEPQSQASFDAQSSSTSTSTTTGSFASLLTTPAVVDVLSPSSANKFDEPFLSDQSEESSDDEGFETVAAPSTTYFNPVMPPIRSPPPSAPTHESLTTEKAQSCSDPIITNGHSQLTSPIAASQINPFKQLILREQQKREHTDDSISSDSGSREVSPSIGSLPAVSSPVDIRSLLAHESNRLDTFKKQNRETFAKVNVGHLAYVGFYLNGEGTLIQCPWCDVHLTEPQFEDIMRTRPSVARSALGDEPWTPMRVHRHANGVLMDKNHSWCSWVRREAGGLYPNVTMVKINFYHKKTITLLFLIAGKSTSLSRISILFNNRETYEIIYI